MKISASLLLVVIVCGCSSPPAKQVKKLPDHSITVKSANIQACLDSIRKRPDFDFIDDKEFMLFKDDRYTKGLEHLHFGKNEIGLKVFPLKNRHDYNALKDDFKRVYLRIRYLPMSESKLTITIDILTLNEWHTCYLEKVGNSWVVKKCVYDLS